MLHKGDLNMGETHYDIVTVGGGLGGSSLAKAMSEHGQRVLVLEREMNFRDRVRGEFMTPWGVAEAKSLGIYELIRDNCGIDAQVSHLGFGPRDLPSTTPQQLPGRILSSRNAGAPPQGSRECGSGS